MLDIIDIFRDNEAIPFSDLVIKSDPDTGLQAIIAVHSTTRGPALGGCRFIEYPSTPAAITDALRLARGMSYKAAISNLDFGGGKAVIIKPKSPFNRTELFHAFGEMVDSLQGRYITAKDSGTVLTDMDTIHEKTPYVASTSSMSDPSPYTAHGVLRAIEATVQYKWGRDNLKDLTVAIQGVGYVGYYLAKELHKLGVQLIVTDIDETAVSRCEREFGAQRVNPASIYSVEADIFSPCALGGILNDETIPQLKASIVAGAANNQLENRYHGDLLQTRGILYAPDYLINAGGLIQATTRYTHGNDDLAKEKIENIYLTLLDIFDRANQTDLPTYVVADQIAEERLTQASHHQKD